VNGGARITQTIKITNNGGAAASNLIFGTQWTGASTYLRGNARNPGAGKITLTVDKTAQTILSHKFTLAKGKSVKATIAYKTPRCVGTAAAPSPKFDFGEAAVTIDPLSITGTCAQYVAPTEVTITRRKTCP
jgi:hypothetical protein